MTNSRIDKFTFAPGVLTPEAAQDPRYRNWPVVYTIDNAKDVYVGESLNVATRMRQHLTSGTKKHLHTVRIVVDNTFNKSVCLDLESHLIKLFAGDGQYRVLNGNTGVTDADYFDRPRYQALFREIFAELQSEGMLSRTVPEIENSDLYKMSPYKTLTSDQAIAVEDILEGLVDDLHADRSRTVVIQGDPGTGKTVIAIYLLKLIGDIASMDPEDVIDGDSMFADFFLEGNKEALTGLKVGLVIPQQSLRVTVKKVFRKTAGLSPAMVLTPFEVGKSSEKFDLLIVDETHRLSRRANQPSASLNVAYREINEQLFGHDDPQWTQLDWVRAQSRHQIFLLDTAQSVRPADISAGDQRDLMELARNEEGFFQLSSQLRVAGGADYIQYVRSVLSDQPPARRSFGDYDLRFFDNFALMHDEIRERDREFGLARLVAGYAWKWHSKKDKIATDIDLDGRQLTWNRTSHDWISSPGSLEEMGSIHTVQGYDLNYAGVVIGSDLRFDPDTKRLVFDRANYFDQRGSEKIPRLGVASTDDEILAFIQNIYGVLLTRGVRGTYVYVCDPALREHLRPYFTR